MDCLKTGKQTQRSGHTRTAETYPVGHAIYQCGDTGQAWRVAQGVIRLNTQSTDGHPDFASLAIVGDIIGCETLLFGTYTFSASALTACRLRPWPEGENNLSDTSLLASLTRTQQRAAELLSLRGGQAITRVLSLIRLLADQAGQLILPTRQDIADITDLRFETISRIIKQLERKHILTPIRLEGVHVTRSYRVDLATIT